MKAFEMDDLQLEKPQAFEVFEDKLEALEGNTDADKDHIDMDIHRLLLLLRTKYNSDHSRNMDKRW